MLALIKFRKAPTSNKQLHSEVDGPLTHLGRLNALKETMGRLACTCGLPEELFSEKEATALNMDR